MQGIYEYSINQKDEKIREFVKPASVRINSLNIQNNSSKEQLNIIYRCWN